MNGYFLLLPIVVSVFVIAISFLAFCLVRSLFHVRERRRHIALNGQDKNKFEVTGVEIPPGDRVCLLVVLGSGGHTAEMLTLVNDVVGAMRNNVQITYVYGSTDNHSRAKAAKMSLVTKPLGGLTKVTETFQALPRAREVGQSWTSSVWTSLKTSVTAAKLLWSVRPHVVLTNGPGTSAIVGAIAFGLHTLWPQRLSCQVVYVESFARVETLSMSGRLMYLFADRFLVQWSQLRTHWPLSECYGRLC